MLTLDSWSNSQFQERRTCEKVKRPDSEVGDDREHGNYKEACFRRPFHDWICRESRLSIIERAYSGICNGELMGLLNIAEMRARRGVARLGE